MHTGFAEAAINGRHRVFGYRLQPLSAAHLLLLRSIRSPVVGKGECKADDLLLACKVCSTKVQLVQGAWLPRWNPSATVYDMAVLAWYSVNPYKLAAQVKRWESYCADYLTTPEKCETPNHDPEPLTSPGEYAAVMQGIKLFGERRAWSMPFGLLRTCVEAHAEATGLGGVKFLPGQDEIDEIMEAFAMADRAGAEWLQTEQARRMEMQNN